MERTVAVTTGESVAFDYELAGLGSRFLAVFVDTLVQLVIAAAAIGALLAILPAAPAASHIDTNDPYEKIGSAVAIALLTFAAFLLFFGYFILFEWRWNGRTPGKRLLGIRVVRDGGFPLDVTSAAVRNTVRIVEAALGYYAVSAVVMLLSPQNRRLGDMAAGTLVVRDVRYEKPRAFAVAGAADPALRELTGADRDLVRRFAERRPTLQRDARVSLATRIATTLRPKLAASYDHLDDEALLEFLAERV